MIQKQVDEGVWGDSDTTHNRLARIHLHELQQRAQEKREEAAEKADTKRSHWEAVAAIAAVAAVVVGLMVYFRLL